MSLRAALVRVLVVGALLLLAVWAFVSYLHPQFTGERVAELLYCG